MPGLFDRHDRKEARKYYNNLRHGFNRMSHELNKLMKADVVETKDGNYVVKAYLPGFDKKDINIGLKNGILTVGASHSENNDEKDEKTGKYLRRERTASSVLLFCQNRKLKGSNPPNQICNLLQAYRRIQSIAAEKEMVPDPEAA